ncbi:MAG: 4-amino-4-deoxy-L-arabinose transferase [Cytophagales bacterium]|nr:4-amino-4-deoxy-L-arabinose transferase [Cytophaga sp.]
MQAGLTKEDKLFFLLLSITFLIYNFNLGLMPLLADEPTRAIVSLEMVLSNNFIFPTIAGEAYLNKPPLFNWLISFMMQHNALFTEWDLRILSLCAFFLMTIVHYLVISKQVNKSIALWSSLAFLTCGRIIFYDSMMGYIDPVFSLFVLLNFYWIISMSRTQRYALLFGLSYLLCLIAFFLKGLPALAFQACTLSAVFIFRKKVYNLLSFSHLFGISILLLGTAIYYYEYIAYYDLNVLMNALIDQSAQRTPLFNKIEITLVHIVSFPFVYISDLLPFSLLLLFCFNKTFFQTIKKNDYIFYSCIVIFSNIWLYWISSETRARYLFMFLPLFFTIVLYAWQTYTTPLIEKNIQRGIQILIAICSLVIWIIPFNQRFAFAEHAILLTGICFCLLVVTLFLSYKKYIHSFLAVILLLLILRLDFNLFILPLRHKEAPESMNKEVGIAIATLTKDKPLFILNHAPINHDILYYTTINRQAIISTKLKPEYGNYYICNRSDIDTFNLVPVYSFGVTYNASTLFVVKK